MQHRGTLLVLLAILSLVGLTTIEFAFPHESLQETRLAWIVILVFIPLSLGAAIWMAWTWAAMACVIYGTIGLALDLATVTSILGSKGGTNRMLAMSGISGTVNLLMIVYGGRAFWSSLQGSPPPESRPPNPPTPFSSSTT